MSQFPPNGEQFQDLIRPDGMEDDSDKDEEVDPTLILCEDCGKTAKKDPITLLSENMSHVLRMDEVSFSQGIRVGMELQQFDADWALDARTKLNDLLIDWAKHDDVDVDAGIVGWTPQMTKELMSWVEEHPA